jgi:CCR4-NOT transcription complex subunit 2
MDQFDSQRSQQSAVDRGANGGDEFPPLSGQLNGDAMRQSNGFSNTLESPEPSHPQPNGQQTQLPIRDGSNTFQQSQQTPLNTNVPPSQNQSQNQQPSSQTPTSTQPATGVKKWTEMSEQEQYGLAGLSAIFEARKQYDLGGQPDPTIPPEWSNSVLGMGQDLNTLGMDLDSSEPLYPTFHVFPDATGTGSMYDSRSRHPVPAFEVPSAYMVTNVPQMHGRINAFSDGMSRCSSLPRTFVANSIQKPSSRSSTQLHATSHKNWLRRSSPSASGAGTKFSANGCKRTPAKPTPAPFLSWTSPTVLQWELLLCA